MKTNQLMKQLRNNVEQVIGEYLNSQMDYGDDEYPDMTEQQWIDYCTSEIYDMKSDGIGGTWYGVGICDNLKFLGNDVIHGLIIEMVDAEGLLVK